MTEKLLTYALGRGLEPEPIEIELQEVRSIVHLPDRVLHQLIGVVRGDGMGGRGEGSTPVQPSSGHSQVRHRRLPRPTIANPEAEGSNLPVERILDTGRPHVTGPADAGPRQEAPVPLGDLDERFGRVVDPVDPVRATRQGHVAVGVHQAGHDHRPSGVHDLDAARRPGVPFVVGRPDPADRPAVDEHTDADAQTIGAAVGEGGVAIDRPAGVHRSGL
ncbi:MAG: hypothetical protein HW391_1073 [Chloroflexi bacterium]|nr:hypothetical protein [Chloroflexota bacterium]